MLRKRDRVVVIVKRLEELWLKMFREVNNWILKILGEGGYGGIYKCF